MYKQLSAVCSFILFSSALHGADYTIAYTGSLFGYFRYPEVQTASDRGCPSTAPTRVNAAMATTFLDAMQSADSGHENIRVAVGDSFAPFFMGRLMWNDQPAGPKATPLSHWVHKEQWEYGPSGMMWHLDNNLPTADQNTLYAGGGSVPTDNVGCFLRLAQFDAVAPGAFDFMYGPQRLRELANFVHDAGVGVYRPVQMVGSNISMRVQRVDPNQSAGDKPVGNKVITSSDPDTEAVLPSSVLPWMRAVRVKNAVGISSPFPAAFEYAKFDLAAVGCYGAWLRSAGGTGPCNGLTILLTDQAGVSYKLTKNVLSVEIQGGDRMIALNAQPEGHIGTDVDYWIVAEEPGAPQPLPLDRALSVVITPVVGKPKPPKPFFIDRPFFETGSQLPWATPSAGGGQVVILGVVDENMSQLIGRLNSTWISVDRNGRTDDKTETDLNISDPAEALSQVLQFCYAHAACRDKKKILLASMEQSTVYDMLRELRSAQTGGSQEIIDLVIAQADPDRATQERTITYGQADKMPPVLVPGDHVNPADPYEITVRLETAEVTQAGGLITIVNNVKTSNAVKVDLHFDYGAPADKKLLEAWVGAGAITRSSLENLALERMREVCGSEIAMMQHRDVFLSRELVSPPLSADGLFAALNAIFWKGDLIQCRGYDGGTIKSALQQAQKFQTQQDLGLAGYLHKGWPLAIQGVAQNRLATPTQSLINGQYLDTKALYGVAITDFLAYGDTGYPSFPSGQPMPDVPLSRQELRVLSDEIAGKLLHVALPPLKASGFLDSISLSHPAPPPTPASGFGKWFVGLIGKTNDEFAGVSPANAEMEAQQRRYTSIDLYKADAGYSLFGHNGSEASIGTRFPGISSFDVTQADSASLTFDYIARIQRTRPGWSEYLQSELNYGTKDQRKSDGSYTRTQTSNVFYEEIGFSHTFGPRI